MIAYGVSCGYVKNAEGAEGLSPYSLDVLKINRGGGGREQ
jgi:hypothetical protein